MHVKRLNTNTESIGTAVQPHRLQLLGLRLGTRYLQYTVLVNSLPTQTSETGFIVPVQPTAIEGHSTPGQTAATLVA